jgi:glycine/sarcosine N-methyltransferase
MIIGTGKEDNMDQDNYKGFAGRYDLFFHQYDEQDPVRTGFYRTLFSEKKVRNILDCACGTGRDLIMFQSLGLDVSGSDIAESMLIQAWKNLIKSGVPVPLLKVDYRELPQNFDRKFDAVACLSTAIMEMPDETNVIRAFKSMHGVLEEGGILVLTQGTTDRQWKQKPRFIPAVNTSEFSRLFVIDYFERGARYNILDIFHSDTKRDFKTWSIDFAQILLRDDFARLLKSTGFSRTDFFGSYSFEPYDKETSDNLIIVAVK